MAKKKSSKKGKSKAFTGAAPAAADELVVAKAKVGATVQALIAGPNGAKHVETLELDAQQWVVRRLG